MVEKANSTTAIARMYGNQLNAEANAAEVSATPVLPSTVAMRAHAGAQVALKWLVQQNVPLVTKAKTAEYLNEDIDLFDWCGSHLRALDSIVSERYGVVCGVL